MSDHRSSTRRPDRRPFASPALAAAGLALAATLAAGCSPSAAPAGETGARGPAASAEGARTAPGTVSASLRSLDPPAAPGAFAPFPAASRTRADDLLLTWLEPRGQSGHRLRFARFDGRSWSAPVTIAEGERFFANWADFPAVVENETGDLLAHWLEKNGAGTYAYGVRLAHSPDGGETWRPLGWLHDDGTETEHGFVSLLAEGDGFRAVWLDGRETLEGDPMTLRTARIVPAGGGGSLAPERGEAAFRVVGSEVLDESVCDCCQTAASVAGEVPVVAYRDRSSEEVRDIRVVRRTPAGWSEPLPVHRDGWVFPACPVNGPAVTTWPDPGADSEAGGTDPGAPLAVAWFTAADGLPRVELAFSGDGGESFSPPVEVDRERALGRVDVAPLGAAGDGRDEVVVAWLASEEGEGRVYLRRAASGGSLGEPTLLAETASARASGFPRLAATGGGRLFAAWVAAEDDGDGSGGATASPRGVRLAEIDPDRLPAP